ncbi:hypothetical protein IH781_03245, partial [Patescibacteria group bacterium]|nr:hypothetical protein [Patescibacteria group bacterium]
MRKIDLPDTFIVFDLEWTAWEGSLERKWSGPGEYREIYDIGAALVSGPEFEVRGTFRQLVVLELVPELPQYSTDLTGITQQEIDEGGIPFKEMVPAFKKFAGELNIYSWGSAKGNDGDKFAENCQLKSVPNPFLAKQFKNIAEVFQQHGIPVQDYHS